MFNNIRQQLAQLISPNRNSMSLPAQFLRYGNGERMNANWSDVLINDKDLYTGYGYAAIRNRAVKVAEIAADHLKTENKMGDPEFVHPYLPMIWDSKLFSESMFWSHISTFLDLEGVYYLMIVRASSSGRTGNPKYLKLLNPYNVRRVVDSSTLAVTGYVETRKGLVREIPPDMIIEIRELNPFSEDDPFSMIDAAKENQFTLKASGDYTRNVITNNINAPGILSTDVILDDQNFANFKARITKHMKGEPLFGNGSGAINYTSMTQDLSKAALKDTNDINVTALLAAAGVSKTNMGIEQSGVTRETSKVQRDLFVSNQIMPRIQLILDALNLDYRNHYEKEYTQNEAYLCVDNPQEVDQATEKTKAEVKKANFELYQSMLAKGYSPKKAAGYAMGELEVDEIGKPKEVKPVIEPDVEEEEDQPTAESLKKKENKLQLDSKAVIEHHQALLKSTVINVERQLVSAVIAKVEKNQFEEETDILPKRQKKNFIDELSLVLAAFYFNVFQLQGPETMAERVAALGMFGVFKVDREANKYIQQVAQKVAESHIQTITSEILQTAREAALEGLSQSEIINRIKQNFADEISKTRAETVARTETNRAFTQAQYQADRQFIRQNKLEGKAFKKWVTRSSNPCAFCKSLEDEGLIPFDLNFRDLGEEVVVGSGKDQKTLNINFESLQAGNAHPNCSCIYELVIQ